MPDEILEAFKAVKPELEPTRLVVDKVLLVLFQNKFGDCRIDVVQLQISIC